MAKNAPADRKYSEEHEWVKIEGNDALVGISDHAQASLGDVVYVELPDEGTAIVRGKPIGVVESVKAVSDIFAPLSGVVKAVNRAIIDNPEIINRDAYGEGWLLLVEITNKSEENLLLDSTAYQEFLEREAK